MDELWLQTLLMIDSEGTLLASRNGQSSEILGFSAKMGNVNQNFLFNKVRNLSPYYACAEFLWYLSMTDDSSFLQLFAPSYSRFCEDGVHAFGAYGHRWKMNTDPFAQDQLTNAIEVLKIHPESRQAIMTMWNATDLEHAVILDKKDLPCTLTHQFLFREGYLHLVTNMRSNDVWLGMPYDVFCNTQLLKLIADCIGAIPGSYTHNSGSMHYYEKNFEKIDAILSAPKEKIEAPLSKHFVGITGKSLKEQISLAISWVEDSAIQDLTEEKESSEFWNTRFLELLKCHSVISDAALVCSSKWNKDVIDSIVDPQLKKAIEEYND